ncbi:MAG: hypothetical protein GY913_25100 [Proteobacteria bacterium]|nr:hypothetical protein [Pseudomonadota bacterium]MCP4920191.1 hypothetical protein [Pseudomonadota bacterium]
MGFRDKLKGRVRSVVDKLSGEYSAPAPKGEDIKPFERDLPPDPDAKILRAKLERPRDKYAKKKKS